jgi:hypothetical protein
VTGGGTGIQKRWHGHRGLSGETYQSCNIRE